MANNRPLFSIVIPTRNRPELANTTLARALEQTCHDYEVVVLENSDHSSLGSWAERDARVRVVPARHTLSLPDNWERGLDLVRGEYVIYLSDKDWLVPHALAELETVVDSFRRPAIVNVRKARWIRETGLLMQRGTGRVANLPSAPVLSRWFSGVDHLHNAPMIYNSIVRCDLIDVVRGRCGGRFFLGCGQDVASSLLLLANTQEYVVLDRIHVMGHFGPWSIGTATVLHGRQGAAARWAAEFATDPISAAGLVWSLSGAIAETLMACQHADPERFAPYHINWRAYLDLSLSELARRANLGQDVRGDFAVLRRGIGRLYPRTTWWRALLGPRLRASLQRYVRAPLRWLRDETPLRVLSPAYARLRRRAEPLAVTPEDSAVSFSGACYRPEIPVPTPEEAFALILRDQVQSVPAAVAHGLRTCP